MTCMCTYKEFALNVARLINITVKNKGNQAGQIIGHKQGYYMGM